MKTLVIGGSGVIGSKAVDHFIKLGHEVDFTYFSHDISNRRGGHQLDITVREEIKNLIMKVKPQAVIHCSALANVDLCETNNILADSINIDGTSNIIEACKALNCKIIYISTSFVFDGTKPKYHEEDKPSPTTYYGLTKYKGEMMVKDSGLSFLILRTDQPYCWTEKGQRINSVLRVIHTLRSGKILKEIIDWYNTPTYVPNLVSAMEKLLEDDTSGIFHVVGSEFINRYDWALKVADIFELNSNLIEPITSDLLKLPARRANVNLNNQKLFLKTGIQTSRINEGLTDMKLIEK